jgi:cation:H+ antiporter
MNDGRATHLDACLAFMAVHPWAAIPVFIVASLLLVWALERMARHGLEGTALGTIAMPYCSGLGNLVFVLLVLREGRPGSEVVVNALVNNVTNLTLLLGLPALIWGLSVAPHGRHSKKAVRTSRLNRLSLALTLAAAGFFAGMLWLLGRDGSLGRTDGAVLIALFIFWQCLQVVDTLKSNVYASRRLHPALLLDALVMLAAGAVIYLSVESMVVWIESAGATVLGSHGIGWITGWVMVLPNAILAIHYARTGRAEIVYSSQLGDGHICIPLCIGIAALGAPMQVPEFFTSGLLVIAVAVAVHAGVLMWNGTLSRPLGLALAGTYGYFLVAGLA